MKVKSIFILFVFIGVFFSSCKTEFEKVRASGDPEKMVETADKYFEDENYLQAQTLYEIVIPFYRGKERAADIFFKYAYTHYHLSEFILANHYFKNFSNTYINDPNREEALYMAAYSNYALSPNFKLDQSYSDVAISEFQLFINTFPNSKKVKEANELIIEMRKKQEIKAFHQGELYLNIKQYEAALVSFENMIQEFPDSELVEEARYKSVLASYDLAKNSIYSKQLERFEEVLERIELFKKKHPKSKYNRELKSLIKDSKNKIKEIL
jgi:outer membrane protein assembly factor BamD